MGGLERTKINLLRLLCFRFRKWLVCATYLLYRLDADPLASGSFFQKKVATQNLWIGNGRSRKTKKNKVRAVSNTTEGSRKRRLPQLKTSFRFLQTDVISQESNDLWPGALLCSSVTLCLPSPHYVVVSWHCSCTFCVGGIRVRCVRWLNEMPGTRIA